MILTTIELDRIHLLGARHDFQFVVFEQQTQIGFERRALHGDLHVESEGAIAIFIVHDQPTNPPLAQMHIRRVGVLWIEGDTNRVIAESLTQKRLQLPHFGFFQHSISAKNIVRGNRRVKWCEDLP